jgi:hypothetical protein
VYDMYPWDSASSGGRRPQAPHETRHEAPAASGEAAATRRKASPPARATQAVQVALDRRDNGGDAAAAAAGPVGAAIRTRTGPPRQ